MPDVPFSTGEQNASKNAASQAQVAVVAADFALGEYYQYSTYICQPHRTFRPVEHVAFYRDKKIDRHIPKVLGQIEAISCNEIETRTDISDIDKARLRTLLHKLTPERRVQWGKEQFKIVFLTPYDSPETLVLSNDIVNNLTSKNGRVYAFTYGQRYVPLSRFIEEPQTTSELV